MKTVVFLFLCFALTIPPQIEFAKKVHDFGRVAQGEIACEFKVKNMGDVPIQVATVNSSSGCLYFTWPKEPILPNETAVIKAHMTTVGREGTFYKMGYVKFAGIEQPYNLILKGVVVASDSTVTPLLYQK